MCKFRVEQGYDSKYRERWSISRGLDKPFSIFRRTRFQTLLEQISRALQLFAAVTFQELREVRVPDVEDIRPLEHGDALLVGLERLLEVIVLLQE